MAPTTAPKVARLGHIGLYCDDPERMRDFYVDVLGFEVTDEDVDRQLWFLSADPAYDHHMLVLTSGRTTSRGVKHVQQVSWRCGSLDDVLGLYERLRADGTEFELIVSHGNAVGVYFPDPEGNRTEIYWPSGLVARQPFARAIDLDGGSDAVLEQVRRSVEQYGATGYVAAGERFDDAREPH